MSNAPTHSAGIIAPPPVLYVGAFLLGVALQLASPLPLLASMPARGTIAAVLLLASGAVARWALVTLHRMGTTANPYQPSITLAVSGPFRFSRNPMYVAMTGLYVGAALLVNSIWPLVLLVPLLLVMHHGVIVREERYLSEIFGTAYVAYKARVRRWL